MNEKICDMTTNQNDHERQLGVDIIKGLCISLVVLCHTVGFGMFPKPIATAMRAVFLNCFYMVSGWLIYDKINRSFKDVKTVILKRACKLFVPYISFSFVAIIWHIFICVLLNNREVSETYFGWDVVKRDFFCMISGLGIGTLWFLPVLLVSFSITFALAYLARRQHFDCILELLMIVVFALGIVLLGGIKIEPSRTVNKLLSEYILFANRICYACFFSLIGYVINYSWKYIKKVIYIAWPMLVISILLIGKNDNTIVLTTMICTAFFVAIMLVSRQLWEKTLFTRCVIFLGQNSLSIMILHYIILFPIEKAFMASGFLFFFVNYISTIVLMLLLNKSRYYRKALGQA